MHWGPVASAHSCQRTCERTVKQTTTSPLLSFFISAFKDIVPSVSVSRPLWGELCYRLCKQSVSMCCCLATHVGVESNGISTAIAIVFERVSTHMWDLCMSCDTMDIWCMCVRYVLTWHTVCACNWECEYVCLCVEIWRRWVCPGGYVWFSGVLLLCLHCFPPAPLRV